MRTLRLATCILVELCLALPLLAQSTTMSLAQYITELKAVQTTLAIEKPSAGYFDNVVGSLPDAWVVETDGHTFSVPTATLAEQINRYRKDSRDAQSLADARQTVRLLLADATAMTEGGTVDGERKRLDDILARSEFRQATGETWWDKLKQKAQQLLLHLLGNMISSSSFPVVSRILIWLVVGVSAVLLAVWVARNYLRSGTYTTLAGIPGAISEKPWRDWHAEAKAAAEQGHWREAIHLSYWAGISFLEGQGLWRPDRARTPREYLRLLPAKDEHHGALAELTRGFETAWYGNDQATEREFIATTELLERLGCR